jgi:plasmid stabilization system protein ParE
VFTVVFTPAARTEVIDAQDWYEGQAPGLGRRFRAAVDTVTQHMAANPRQFPTVFKNVRRALLRRFPYALFFVVGRSPVCHRLLSRQPRSSAMAAANDVGATGGK